MKNKIMLMVAVVTFLSVALVRILADDCFSPAACSTNFQTCIPNISSVSDNTDVSSNPPSKGNGVEGGGPACGTAAVGGYPTGKPCGGSSVTGEC